VASVIWHLVWRISGATVALINFHRCRSFDHLAKRSSWRAGNLAHLAEHERDALIVEPGDITGLSTALERLSEDG
jgi:hypothetical protein